MAANHDPIAIFLSTSEDEEDDTQNSGTSTNHNTFNSLPKVSRISLSGVSATNPMKADHDLYKLNFSSMRDQISKSTIEPS